MLLVSIHDMQVQGQDNMIGYTFLEPRALAGILDAWHPLHAGPAYMKGAGDAAELLENEKVSGRIVGVGARQLLRGHSGTGSSLNIITSYCKSTP